MEKIQFKIMDVLDNWLVQQTLNLPRESGLWVRTPPRPPFLRVVKVQRDQCTFSENLTHRSNPSNIIDVKPDYVGVARCTIRNSGGGGRQSPDCLESPHVARAVGVLFRKNEG